MSSSLSLTQVVKTHIMVREKWDRVAYATPQDMTLKGGEVGVEARFEPVSGNGWRTQPQGKQKVGIQGAIIQITF